MSVIVSIMKEKALIGSPRTSGKSIIGNEREPSRFWE